MRRVTIRRAAIVESIEMRILYICHNQTRMGGAYYRALNLAGALKKRGHDVALMSIHHTNRIGTVERNLDGVTLVETPDMFWGSGRSGWDPWSTIVRTLWLSRHRFDIVHTVDTRPAVSLPALVARLFNHSTWICDWTDWWAHGGATSERTGKRGWSFIGLIEQLFEEVPRPYADGTVCISRALASRAASLGIQPASIWYLPPSTDPESIRELTVSEALAKCNLESSYRYLGYLGNIYQRDAELLFNSLRLLKHTDWRLLMVGEPKCSVPNDLKDLIQVTGRLSFESMLEHLSACQVLTLPLSDSIANRGRWPSKINEYLAVGRPVVACSVGDVANLIAENGVGLVARPEAEDFSCKLDELLSDPEISQSMGDQARTVAKTVYSQSLMGEQLENFYLRIIKSSKEAKL